MVTCIETCVAELTSQLESADDALGVFAGIPESLLERKLFLGLVTKAASVLAKSLGPVEDLFLPGTPQRAPTRAWSDVMLLNGKVKLFSVLTLEAVLQSKDLRMYAENSTFTLAYWWCRHQPGREQQAFFTRLLESSLYFDRMSSDFLGSVVALCPGYRVGPPLFHHGQLVLLSKPKSQPCRNRSAAWNGLKRFSSERIFCQSPCEVLQGMHRCGGASNVCVFSLFESSMAIQWLLPSVKRNYAALL